MSEEHHGEVEATVCRPLATRALSLKAPRFSVITELDNGMMGFPNEDDEGNGTSTTSASASAMRSPVSATYTLNTST